MIKRILLMFLMLFIIVGCATKLEDNKVVEQNDDKLVSDDISSDYKTELLEKVKSKNLLFNEKISFIKIEFSVRANPLILAGKDIYNIDYLSKAEPEDTYKVYTEYMDSIEEDFSNEFNTILYGFLEDLPMSVAIENNPLNNLEGYPVRLKISENPEDFQEKNPYFSEYPDIVEVYKVNKDTNQHTEETYIENYIEDVKTYYTSFSTSASEEEFYNFYLDNYGEKENFRIEEDEYQNRFYWTDSEYDVRVVFEKSINGAIITLEEALSWKCKISTSQKSLHI